MLRKLIICSLFLFLFGCNTYDTNEKFVYFKSEFKEHHVPFSTIADICGNNVKIEITGEWSNVLSKHISFTNCKEQAAFIDYNYRLLKIDLFVDIDYKNKYFEIYSYDKKVVDYTEYVADLEDKLLEVAQVSIRSFEYSIKETTEDKKIEDQRDIERDRKLIEMKKLNSEK